MGFTGPDGTPIVTITIDVVLLVIIAYTLYMWYWRYILLYTILTWVDNMLTFIIYYLLVVGVYHELSYGIINCEYKLYSFCQWLCDIYFHGSSNPLLVISSLIHCHVNRFVYSSWMPIWNEFVSNLCGMGVHYRIHEYHCRCVLPVYEYYSSLMYSIREHGMIIWTTSYQSICIIFCSISYKFLID